MRRPETVGMRYDCARPGSWREAGCSLVAPSLFSYLSNNLHSEVCILLDMLLSIR
jgi:hypothetical protein